MNSARFTSELSKTRTNTKHTIEVVEEKGRKQKEEEGVSEIMSRRNRRREESVRLKRRRRDVEEENEERRPVVLRLEKCSRQQKQQSSEMHDTWGMSCKAMEEVLPQVRVDQLMTVPSGQLYCVEPEEKSSAV